MATKQNQTDSSNFFSAGFAQFVRNASAAKDMTAADIHRATGISRSYMYKFFDTSGGHPSPDLGTAYLICNALGTDFAKVVYALQLQADKKNAKPAAKTVPLTRDQKPRVRVVDNQVSAYDGMDALDIVNTWSEAHA